MSRSTLNGVVVKPSGSALGAEIEGVDIALGVNSTTMTTIRNALRDHLVIVLRDQKINDDQLIAFSQQLGELDPPGPSPYGGSIYPQYPLLNVISNIVENNRPVGNLGAGEAVWHADMTYNDMPPKGAVLYAVELPPAGGDTQFACMRSAYDTLPEALRARALQYKAIHDASHNSAGMRRKGYEEITDVRQTPGAHHPLVRTDPASARKSLFLGRRPRSYVPGLSVPQSDALLDELWAHATQEQFVFTHNWRLGDLLIWDNLSVLHRRDEFNPEQRRRLHRTQLKGEHAIT